MRNVRNWIIGSGIVMFLAVGGKSIATDKDIPENMKTVLLMVFGAGLGIEPLTGLAKGITAKKGGGKEE